MTDCSWSILAVVGRSVAGSIRALGAEQAEREGVVIDGVVELVTQELGVVLQTLGLARALVVGGVDHAPALDGPDGALAEHERVAAALLQAAGVVDGDPLAAVLHAAEVVAEPDPAKVVGGGLDVGRDVGRDVGGGGQGGSGGELEEGEDGGGLGEDTERHCDD